MATEAPTLELSSNVALARAITKLARSISVTFRVKVCEVVVVPSLADKVKVCEVLVS